METNLSKLERDLENFADSDDPEDKFKEVMSEFYNQAKEQCELLVEMFNNMTNMFKEIGDYFCFDLKKTQLEDFFGDLSSFLQQYQNAKKDNIKRKEREEKERKARERAVSFVFLFLFLNLRSYTFADCTSLERIAAAMYLLVCLLEDICFGMIRRTMMMM